jgi:parallel beta-helix repeat protein
VQKMGKISKFMDASVSLPKVLLVVVLTSLITCGAVVASIPVQPFTVSRGIYPGAPEYTIFVEDGTYYAKSAHGPVVYSDSTLVDLLDSVEANRPASIFFTAGNYLFTKTWQITHGDLVVYGEGKQTDFWADGDIDFLIEIVSPNTPSEYTSFVHIRDISFYNPNWDSYDITAIHVAIDTGIVWYLTVENCYFMIVNAVWTEETEAPKALVGAVFNNLHVELPPNYAFRLYDTIDARFMNIVVQAQSYTPGTYGLFLKSDLSSGVIINNFFSFHCEYGIYVDTSSNTIITNSVADFASVGYTVHDSSECRLTNNYAHASNGEKTGYLISGAGNSTFLFGNHAIGPEMTYGFRDVTSSGGNVTLTGNFVHQVTTPYDLQYYIALGNWGLTDQPGDFG